MKPVSWTTDEIEAFSGESATRGTAAAWQSRAFSISDAIDWSVWGLSPSQADAHRARGANAPPDQWYWADGWTLQEALLLSRASISATSAYQWKHLGLKVKEIIQLEEVGVTGEEFAGIAWRVFGTPRLPQVLLRFLRLGLDLEQAVSLIAVRITPAMVERVGPKPDELDDFIHFALGWFHDAGIPATQAVLNQAIRWLRLGLDLEQAVSLIEVRITPAMVERVGPKPDELDNFIHFVLAWTRAAGVSATQAVLNQAIRWVQQEFSYDTAEEWLAWRVTPEEAAHFHLEREFSPPIEFRDEGVSISEAYKWIDSGFLCDEDADDEHPRHWRKWSSNGFDHSQAVSLLLEMDVSLKQLSANLLPQDLEKIVGEVSGVGGIDDDEIDTYLCNLSDLVQAGLPITAKNLIAWMGLSAKAILECIDNGVSFDTAYLLSDEFTPREIASLRSKGIDVDHASRLSSLSGVGVRTVLSWLESGWEKFDRSHTWRETVAWLSTKLDPRVALKWYKAQFTPESAVLWIGIDVTDPLVAREWSEHGFQFDESRRWIERGVLDPMIAARRQAAGIEP